MKFLSGKDFCLLMIVVLFWGAHVPVIKIALGEIEPLTLTFLRSFFTSLLFVPFFKRVSTRDLKALFQVSITFVTLHYAVMYMAIESINSNSFVVLNMLALPISIILSAIFLNEKFGLWVVVGLLISFAGLIAAFGLPDVQQYPLGALLTLLTSLLWAVGSLSMKKTAHIPKMTFTFYVFAMSVPFMFLLAVFKEGNVIQNVMKADSQILIGSVTYQVVIIGYMTALWGGLIGRNRAEFVTPFLLLQVPVAAVVSYFMLGETINDTFLLSSALILGGIGIIHTRRIMKVLRYKS